ncbi:MAG: hypothetical protein ACTH31_09495, partial [Pseudoclavibacter sp.]
LVGANVVEAALRRRDAVGAHFRTDAEPSPRRLAATRSGVADAPRRGAGHPVAQHTGAPKTLPTIDESRTHLCNEQQAS